MRSMRLGLRLALPVLAWLAADAALVGAAEGAGAATTVIEAPAEAAPIAGSRAADYVGQDVTIEGRVAAIHESPLATVLAFAPNFAGFTATILAGDRDKFPSDLEARLRDHLVRVTGTVTAYRGKPEMALRDPAQLVLAPAPGPGSVAAQPAPVPIATADGALDDIRRALSRIEARLGSFESRLDALEQAPVTAGEPAPDVRP
jgi:hypothetical protein